MATIRKRGTRYQAQVRKKGHGLLTKSFTRKGDAEAWAKKIEADIEAGVFRDTSEAQTTSLGQVLDRYRREVLSTHSRSWLSHLNTIKDRLGHLNLAALQSHHLAAYRDKRLRQVSAQSVKHELGLIDRVLKQCVGDWGIHLPKGIPSVSKPKLPNGRERRLQAGEEQRIVAALKHTPTVRAVVLFALETAMRREEIANARWEHVSLKQRVLRVPDTKTDTPRSVPLSPQAVSILQGLPRRMDGQVFGVRPDTITQAFERAVARARKHYAQECSRASREPDGAYLANLRFHDLRHEAASRLFEKGFSVMEVASITGHKDLRMLRRYTHLRAEDLAARM